MATGDLSDPQANSLTLSKVKLLTMFRLGLFQMGLDYVYPHLGRAQPSDDC